MSKKFDASKLYEPEYNVAESGRAAKRILAGKTRTKPKLIVHPKHGTLHRLVIPEGGNAPYYQELVLDDDRLMHLHLSPKRLKRQAAQEIEPLPDPYHIRSFRMNSDEPSNYPEITLGDMHIIISALGREYRWSETEYASGEYAKKPRIVHLLFSQNKVVGACGWTKDGDQWQTKKVAIPFYLLSSEVRGKGLGRALLQHMHHEVSSTGGKEIVLSTSDSCKNRKGKPVVEFYKRQGYKVTDTFDFSYKKFKKLNVESPVVVPEAFFRDPETGDELPRFQRERLNAQLDRVSQKLLAASDRLLEPNAISTHMQHAKRKSDDVLKR